MSSGSADITTTHSRNQAGKAHVKTNQSNKQSKISVAIDNKENRVSNHPNTTATRSTSSINKSLLRSKTSDPNRVPLR